MSSDDLQARLAALRDAATLLRRHRIPVDNIDVEGLVDRAGNRLRHGTEHTVVALVGSTGSGKSSMLNALAGESIARVGVTRPTTAVTQAVTFGRPAEGLLDHLGIALRHGVSGDEHTDGLVLLDLPDFDSVADAHRMEVDRLVQMVDLMMWVTDPQKYGDEALHDGYLRPLATHADVMQVVLNKVDTIGDEHAVTCLTDLGRLLEADGLEGVRPLGVSTVTGEGLDELRGILAAEVTARAAAIDRISADISAMSLELRLVAGAAAHGDLGEVRRLALDGLAGAADVSRNAGLVGLQYRRDAGLAVGWPPLRVIRRLRRAPLERRITSSASSIARSEVNRALRSTAERIEGSLATAEGPAGGWADAASTTVRDRTDHVLEALDTQTTRGIQTLRTAPRWWGAVRWLHGLWLLALVVGVVWLIGIAVAESLLLIDVQRYVPRWRGVAAPTGLAGIGLLGGIATALVGRWLSAVGARRRSARARAELTERVGAVVDTELMDPIETLLSDARQVTALLDRADGATGRPSNIRQETTT